MSKCRFEVVGPYNSYLCDQVEKLHDGGLKVWYTGKVQDRETGEYADVARVAYIFGSWELVDHTPDSPLATRTILP